MLDPTIKQQLSSHLQALNAPVELIAYPGSGTASDQLVELIEEIDSLSENISLRRDQQTPLRRPALGVRATGRDTEIRFAGVPLGHEFTSLVMAILHSGDHPLKVDADTLAQIRSLDRELVFETFVSLSCQNCPEVVQALNMMAAINPNIRHEMIDGALFQEEVEARSILAVPAVFLNGKPFAQGRISLGEILSKLDEGANQRRRQQLSKAAPFDMLVVGGGPAGASAAIYAARKGIRTGIVAERFGGQLQDTVSIENFISVPETEGPKLAANLEAHLQRYQVEMMDGLRAKSLSTDAQGLITVDLGDGGALRSRAVLLATGARWREMNVPGEQQYRGRGVAYCPHCDGPLFKGKSVAVIGGGNSGIEAAIDLAGIVQDVTVLEFGSALRADEVLQPKARSMGNIEIRVNAQTTEVLGDGQRVSGLRYTDRRSGQAQTLDVAGIFVQIGLVPNTEFLADSLALSEGGEIIVGEHGETSMTGVFAAGDATTSPYKQIVVAMGSGANAALGAFDYLIRSSVDDANAA